MRSLLLVRLAIYLATIFSFAYADHSSRESASTRLSIIENSFQSVSRPESSFQPPQSQPFLLPRSSTSRQISRPARCDKSCSACVNNARTPTSLSSRVKKRAPVSGSANSLSKEILQHWTPAQYGGDMSKFIIALSQNTMLVPHEFDDNTGEPVASAIYRPLRNEKSLTGVEGLYGCTSVIVASEEGVWISHFWEKSFSTTDWDFDTDYWALTDDDTFKSEVINPMKDGNGKVEGLLQYTKKGGSFAPPNTPRSFIVTPLIQNEDVLSYNSRAKLLQTTLRGWMPDAPEALIVNYTRISKSWDDHDESPKGKAIVQYDPYLESEDDCEQEVSLKVWVEDRTEPVG